MCIIVPIFDITIIVVTACKSIKTLTLTPEIYGCSVNGIKKLDDRALVNKTMPVINTLQNFVGSGLVISKDDHWKNRRKMLVKDPPFREHFDYFFIGQNEQILGHLGSNFRVFGAKYVITHQFSP